MKKKKKKKNKKGRKKKKKKKCKRGGRRIGLENIGSIIRLTNFIFVSNEMTQLIIFAANIRRTTKPTYIIDVFRQQV